MNHYDISVNADSTRRDTLDGREHLVVPIKAVEEGVLDGGLLPSDTIEESEPGWNGVPAIAGHPTDGTSVDGRPNFISANQPQVHDNLSFGKLFGADATDGEMTAELWLDVEKAAALEDDGFDVPQTAIEMLENDEDVALSTSYIPTEREENPGHYDGQAYQHVIQSIQPDHIGVLPNGQGRDPSARTLVANSMRSITNTLSTVLSVSDDGAAEGETAANQESMPDITPEDLTLNDHVAPFLASATGLPEDDVAALVDAMNPDTDPNPDAVAGAIEASDAVDADAVADAMGVSANEDRDADTESDAGSDGDGAGEGETAANQGTDFSARVAANQRDDGENSRDVSFGSYSSRRNADDN
jgi:hypothetical protein